jgi:hypothetical protein
VNATDATAVRTAVVTIKVNPRPAPVITITKQPVAPTGLVQGEIPRGTTMTVEASVTEGAELEYQWYKAGSAEDTNGFTIEGATSASYTIPTSLEAATYHYLCKVSAEGAKMVQTNTVTMEVWAPPVKKTIAVSEQSLPAVSGKPRTVWYKVTTTGFEPGEYDVEFWNDLAWENWTFSNQRGKLSIDKYGTGRLYFTYKGATRTGQSNQCVTIDGVKSNYFFMTSYYVGTEPLAIAFDTDLAPEYYFTAAEAYDGIAKLTVEAAVGDYSTPSYQWYNSGFPNAEHSVPVTVWYGGNTATVEIGALMPGNTYYYYCEATSGGITKRSEIAKVVIGPAN